MITPADKKSELGALYESVSSSAEQLTALVRGLNGSLSDPSLITVFTVISQIIPYNLKKIITPGRKKLYNRVDRITKRV